MNKSSKYKGVWWLNREKVFMAAIKINGKRKVAGYYANDVNAAHARDLVAREAGRPESDMNFPKKEKEEENIEFKKQLEDDLKKETADGNLH